MQRQLSDEHDNEIKIYCQDLEKRNKLIRALEEDNKNMESLINKLRMNSTGSYVIAKNQSMIEMSKDKAKDTFILSENTEKKEQQNVAATSNYASVLSNYQS